MLLIANVATASSFHGATVSPAGVQTPRESAGEPKRGSCSIRVVSVAGRPSPSMSILQHAIREIDRTSPFLRALASFCRRDQTNFSCLDVPVHPTIRLHEEGPPPSPPRHSRLRADLADR